MGGPEVEHLIALLARLPGLGPRSARRAALKMLQEPEKRMLPLAVALADAARAVKPCADCGNLDSQDPRITLDVVTKSPRPVRMEHVLSTSYGIGGQNAVLVLGR